MKHLEIKLKKKGWKEKEIYKTIRVLDRIEKKKSHNIKIIEIIARILILATSITAVLSGAIFLIPILTVLRGVYAYPIIIIVSLFLGYMVDMLLNKTTLIKNIFNQFIAILITSIFAIYFITDIVNKIAGEYNIALLNDPVSVSLIYSITLTIPFFTHYFIHVCSVNKNIYK